MEWAPQHVSPLRPDKGEDRRGGGKVKEREGRGRRRTGGEGGSEGEGWEGKEGEGRAEADNCI